MMLAERNDVFEKGFFFGYDEKVFSIVGESLSSIATVGWGREDSGWKSDGFHPSFSSSLHRRCLHFACDEVPG